MSTNPCSLNCFSNGVSVDVWLLKTDLIVSVVVVSNGVADRLDEVRLHPLVMSTKAASPVLQKRRNDFMLRGFRDYERKDNRIFLVIFIIVGFFLLIIEAELERESCGAVDRFGSI